MYLLHFQKIAGRDKSKRKPKKKKSGEKNNIVMITHPLCKFNKFHENNIKEMVVYIIYILVW
jgi:hypothetical protein